MLLRSFRRSSTAFVAALITLPAAFCLRAQGPADEAHTRTRPADLAAIAARDAFLVAFVAVPPVDSPRVALLALAAQRIATAAA